MIALNQIQPWTVTSVNDVLCHNSVYVEYWCLENIGCLPVLQDDQSDGWDVMESKGMGWDVRGVRWCGWEVALPATVAELLAGIFQPSRLCMYADIWILCFFISFISGDSCLWMNVYRKTQWHYVTLVAIAVVVRPTSAIIWFPLCAWHMWHMLTPRRSLWKFLSQFFWRGWDLLCLLLYPVIY